MARIALATLLVCAIAAGGCVSVRGSVVHQTWEQPYGKLRHVVMYAYKDEATAAQRAEVETRFRKLPEQIDLIRAFECGVETSGRNMNKGLTHCNLFTFDNRQDLQSYLDHPAHQEFVAFARPLLKDLFVFDYIAEE